jgi:tripeptidyl-peptidase-1
MPTIQLEGMRPIPNLLPKIAAPSLITGLDGLATCAELTTILCLRALYNFGPGNTSAAGNEMGIGEWADFLYLPDLPLFFKNFTTQPIPADTVPDFISIDGGQTANFTYDDENESGVESAVDFQTAYSIIHPQKLRLYQVGDGVNIDSVGTFNIFS